MSIRSVALVLSLAATLVGAARASTLFADLGARPGLERIVDSAATIWLADPRVAKTFEDTNIVRFKKLLVDQLCQLAGGGCVYAGRDMREAHKGLHLDTLQFNVLAEDLQLAMDRSGVGFSVQNRLLALLAPMHRDVVSR